MYFHSHRRSGLWPKIILSGLMGRSHWAGGLRLSICRVRSTDASPVFFFPLPPPPPPVSFLRFLHSRLVCWWSRVSLCSNRVSKGVAVDSTAGAAVSALLVASVSASSCSSDQVRGGVHLAFWFGLALSWSMPGFWVFCSGLYFWYHKWCGFSSLYVLYLGAKDEIFLLLCVSSCFSAHAYREN